MSMQSLKDYFNLVQPNIPEHSVSKKDGDSFKYATKEELNTSLAERGYKDLAEPTNEFLTKGITKTQLLNGNFSKESLNVLNLYKTVEDFLCISYPVLTEEQRKERQERTQKAKAEKEKIEQQAKRMAIAEAKKNANLPFNQKDRRFSNIIIDDSNKMVIKAMEKYIFNKSPDKKEIGFFLHGKPGTGKTTLLCAFVNELIENSPTGNMSIYFQPGVSIVNDVINDKDLMYKLTHRGVLIIDDITQNMGKDFYIQTLFDIIDKRLNSNLLTLITSNMSIDKMITSWKTKTTEVERLEALRSRLNASMVDVEIKGQDRRQKYTLEDMLNRDL